MYQGLYDQAKQLKNVNYVGYQSHDYILKHLQDYHIFAFPSIWEETFMCLGARIYGSWTSIVLPPIMELYLKHVQSFQLIFLFKKIMYR
jgi:glycosyltransferase involved in cell wall biosynthesis